MRVVHSLLMAACLAAGTAESRAQTVQSGQAQRLTEREAVARFMTSDPRIQAWASRVDEARAQQAERTPWPNPSLTFSREHVAGARDTFLLARQELPVSGRRTQLRDAGRLAVESVEAERRATFAQMQADVREAYLELLLAQEREAVLRRAIDELQQWLKILRAREEAGEGSRYDRMRGQRALIDLEADAAKAEAERAEAQGHLAAYLGSPISLAVAATESVALPQAAPPIETLVAQALSTRGEHRASQLSSERFDAEQRAAMELRIPTPTLTAGLKRSAFAATTHSGYQVSIDLGIPLFSRGQASAGLAAAQRAVADAAAAFWRTRIEADVRSAHAALAIHQERAARYRDATAAVAEPLVATGRVGYEEGELGILELLDAHRQAVDARLRVLELTADARRAAIELDRAIGTEWRP